MVAQLVVGPGDAVRHVDTRDRTIMHGPEQSLLWYAIVHQERIGIESPYWTRLEAGCVLAGLDPRPDEPMRTDSKFGAVYRRFGIRPVINAAGTKTRLGGVPMASDVVEAMRDAASASADIAEMQAAASRFIAQVTGAEAGYVTAGAAAGLMLGAAACLAGDDPTAIDRLPEVPSGRDEIVIFRSHRNSYDHALRAAGAQLVEVGLDDRTAGSGVRTLDRWELAHAISDRTVALAYVANPEDRPPLDMFIDVAHANDLPVLVDAAAMLPPERNLRDFVAAGADLVSFSGGKAIGGPQNTGIVCGRRSLIRAMALNQLDLDVHTETWRLPEEFGHDHERHGLPRHGIGRAAKVAKEQIIGALVALDRFASEAWRDELEARQALADELLTVLAGRVRTERTSHEVPRIRLHFGTSERAISVAALLASGDPSIEVDSANAPFGTLTIDTIGLDEATGAIVVARLEHVLTEMQGG
jgi:D-glucosaminate-6-phosphate ammonia-lyase